MIFDLYAVVSNLPLKLRIVWSDPFPGVSYFCVTYVYNYCHRKNQNCRLKMGLTSHLSCAYDNFSPYCVYFSSMTSLTMIVLGPIHPVHALFNFSLKFLLVVWVAQNLLVVSVAQKPLAVSVEYFHLVESLEYFDLVESMEFFDLVESFEYFDLFKSFENFDLVDSFEYFHLVESPKYFPLKNIHSFKLRIFNIVTVCFCLAYSVRCNFCNTMPRHKPVGVIRQPSKVCGFGALARPPSG